MPKCSSPECGGCYEVEPGIFIHPPKNSVAFEEWRAKFEAKKLSPVEEEFLESWVREQNRDLDKQNG